MNNQKSDVVEQQPAVVGRQPIPVRPVDDLGPAWAESVTPWSLDAEGLRWRRTLVGMFDGARVSQDETWPGVGGLAEFSNMRVIETGPDCPAWCDEHLGDFGGQDVEGAPEQWHLRQVEAGGSGSVRVAATISAITLAGIEFSAVPIIEVDRYERLSVADARQLAEVILRAVELVEEGVGEVTTETPILCPAWCVEHVNDSTDGTLLIHVGREHGDGDRVRLRPMQLAVAVSTADIEGPFIDLSPTSDELSPADAASLAVSLLRVADLVQPGVSRVGLTEAMMTAVTSSAPLRQPTAS